VTFDVVHKDERDINPIGGIREVVAASPLERANPPRRRLGRTMPGALEI
jgi:hypothetical protein